MIMMIDIIIKFGKKDHFVINIFRFYFWKRLKKSRKFTMQKSSPDFFKIVTKITNPQNSWKLFDTFLNPRSMKFKLFYQIYIIMILLLNFMRWKFFISSLLRNAIVFFIDFLFLHSILLCNFFFFGFIWKKFIGKKLSRMIFNLLMDFGSWFATKAFYQICNKFHSP